MLSEMDQPYPKSYSFLSVGVSLVFFTVINYLVKKGGKPKNIKEDVSFWRWKNIFISFIHASISGFWNISLYAFEPELFSDLLNYRSLPCYLHIAFSAGYFTYDFFDMLLNGKALKLWELSIHHTVISVAFFYDLYYTNCIAFNVILIAPEINSIFLHNRKLMHFKGVSQQSTSYKINLYLNLITFVIFRFGFLSSVLFGLVLLRNKVSPVFWWLAGTTFTVVMVMNGVLFSRLLKGDVFKKSKSMVNGHQEKHAKNN